MQRVRRCGCRSSFAWAATYDVNVSSFLERTQASPSSDAALRGGNAGINASGQAGALVVTLS